MSLPHTTSKKAESGNDRAGNWIYNTKKEWISNKVDWSTSAINGSHIWLDAEAHGCHIQDCKKTGSRKKCASCKVLVHEKCIDQLERINSCKCRPTFVEGSAPKVPYPQHHVAHRRKQEGKCDKCGKYFQSKLSFQTTKDMISVICSWCKKAVHNKPECSKDMYMDEKCTLGLHHNLIVPPSWIVKLPPRKYSTAQGSRQRRATRRRSSRERRAFLIKPIPGSEDKVPVIVFVNPKSGGNQGSKIMEKFQWLLNPRQVFDLMSDGGPHFGLELYRKVPNLRILVCGGDGSVGWVLSEIDRMKLNPTPPVAVLPLGTGNDLSRFLGWGSGYTDEPLSRVLTQIEGGVVEKFDRWNLDVRINSQVERSDEGQNKLPLSVMNNYFSLGADADVCLEFHESREANPDKFTSRLRNLMFYGKAGGRQVLQSKFKDLHKCIDRLLVPLSPGLPYTKHNGMTFNSAKSISTVDKETMKKMLLQAARKGDIEEFTALHLAEASLIWCDSRGYTSLHLAAKYGRKNIVKYIISNVQKCVLDLVDNERGQTPLHKASYYQRRTICNMLVNAGASLTRLDLEGNTPRLLALQSNDGELAKYLENQERLQIIASDDHETAV